MKQETLETIGIFIVMVGCSFIANDIYSQRRIIDWFSGTLSILATFCFLFLYPIYWNKLTGDENEKQDMA